MVYVNTPHLLQVADVRVLVHVEETLAWQRSVHRLDLSARQISVGKVTPLARHGAWGAGLHVPIVKPRLR